MPRRSSSRGRSSSQSQSHKRSKSPFDRYKNKGTRLGQDKQDATRHVRWTKNTANELPHIVPLLQKIMNWLDSKTNKFNPKNIADLIDLMKVKEKNEKNYIQRAITLVQTIKDKIKGKCTTPSVYALKEIPLHQGHLLGLDILEICLKYKNKTKQIANLIADLEPMKEKARVRREEIEEARARREEIKEARARRKENKSCCEKIKCHIQEYSKLQIKF